MVQQTHGNSGRFLNQEWHETRWEARTETYSEVEWSEIDIVKYDLDTVEFTRKFKDSTYETDPRKEAEGSPDGEIDIRTISNTRD
jgi:hypothetical protein